MRDDFISLYLNYSKGTEVPTIFHRWSVLTGLGAWLGRGFNFHHGHSLINPNMYIMLIGAAGTRKSTSIKMFKRILKEAGYDSFAAEKTTKEKYLIDLAGEEDEESILDRNLWGEPSADEHSVTENFIMADEFNDFFGNNILEFVSMLGSLWDFSGTYSSKVKTSASVHIPNPTISILGGNTQTSFNSVFPPEILGQGFFSRLLLIYGEPTGIKIAFPKSPSKEDTQILVDVLREIKTRVYGEMAMTHKAELLLTKIYTSWGGVKDVRFDSYSNRRFTHLLKLCLITCASKMTKELTEEDVIYANTMLTYAEHFMPKALGEFGKAKNSDIVNKVINILESTFHPVEPTEIWKQVSTDLERIGDLSGILSGLLAADKIMNVKGGIVLKRKLLKEDTSGTVDFSMLTDIEQEEIAK